MYFWNITQLKSDLASEGLPRRDLLLYLAAILAVQALAYFLPSGSGGEATIWDKIDYGVFLASLILGTACCYSVNGGSKGKAFPERYVSLAWVFGVRYALGVVIPSFVGLYLALSLFTDLPDKTVWYEVLLNALLSLFFYVFLASHMRDVALNRISTDNSASRLKGFFAREHHEDLNQSKYPTILRRYLATFIDGVFVWSAFVAVSYVFQDSTDFSVAIRLGVISILFFLYEPLCTSKLCTFGQKAMGIRVRTVDTGRPISIIAAYLRIVVKIALGIISFFSIPCTRKRRAIHDFAAGSVVVHADEDLVGIS